MVVEGVLVCYIGDGDTFFIYNDYFDCLTLMYTPLPFIHSITHTVKLEGPKLS